jgi:hypothetical protein
MANQNQTGLFRRITHRGCPVPAITRNHLIPSAVSRYQSGFILAVLNAFRPTMDTQGPGTTRTHQGYTASQGLPGPTITNQTHQ